MQNNSDWVDYLNTVAECARLTEMHAKLADQQVRGAQQRLALALVAVRVATQNLGNRRISQAWIVSKIEQVRTLADEARDELESAHAIADKSHDEADEARDIAGHARAAAADGWFLSAGA